eukprot:3685334-Alexandrium_andersonii.AAC.1
MKGALPSDGGWRTGTRSDAALCSCTGVLARCVVDLGTLGASYSAVHHSHCQLLGWHGRGWRGSRHEGAGGV